MNGQEYGNGRAWWRSLFADKTLTASKHATKGVASDQPQQRCGGVRPWKVLSYLVLDIERLVEARSQLSYRVVKALPLISSFQFKIVAGKRTHTLPLA